MNRSFFSSWYALASAGAVVFFVAWWLRVDAPLGRAPEQHVGFLLWTGWTAFALYVAVVLYVARKYLHRFEGSPEFRMRVPVESVERAERAILAVQRDIRRGVLTNRKEILERASLVIDREGLERVLKPRVVEAGRTWIVDVHPTEPAGRVATWMKAHLYLGGAAGVLVVLHGGGGAASPMALLLNGLSLAVIGSGLLGILLWALGPSWLTKREKDLSIEQAFVLERSLSEKLQAAKDDATPEMRRELERLPALPSPSQAEQALARGAEADSDEAGRLQDILVLTGQRECVRRDLRRLMHVKWLMNFWRLVHVPLSFLLFALLVVHIVSVWWY